MSAVIPISGFLCMTFTFHSCPDGDQPDGRRRIAGVTEPNGLAWQAKP
ncbi:hypothetical protein BSIN_2222 [Burkholderia singularis]|uniref:Uncharacterized protein n=1 Tax=Burkholderia singularis TaxID=1503053 RepID=A0A238H1B2_9BURK|nr:hypothetical protein BSIN_2222 [Burkholderia singularis]